MRALAWILAEDIIAFAYGEDEKITDDFATAQLQRIAHSLRAAEPAVLGSFLTTVKEMMREAREQDDATRLERLASIPDRLGLGARARLAGIKAFESLR